jgi:DNA-binding transcriptional LysR family regulator
VVAPLPKLTREEDLEPTFLYDNHLRVVVGPKSPWARRRKVTLSDLIGEPWCLPPVDTAAGAVFINALRASGLPPPRIVVSSASNQLCHRLLADGRFVGVSSDVTLNFDPYRPPLKVLPIELPTPIFTIGIVTLKNRTISPVARLFIDCAREIVRPLVRAGAR